MNSKVTQLNIFIVTIDGFFGQSIPTEKSLNTATIKEGLEAAGFTVQLLDIERLANQHEWGNLDNSVFLVGSHQNPEIKKYLDDIIATASICRKVNFIPRPELLLAHENKGIQCLLGRMLTLNLPHQDYRITEQDLNQPNVIKHVSGAGSQKVFIAKENQSYNNELIKTGLSLMTVRDLLFYMKTPIKQLMRWKHFTNDYIKYNKRYFRHVRQKLLPSPGFDFKVLVFFDRVYVLQRGQRAGDFRASGSGEFTFIKPNHALVQFALTFREKLDTPYVSLDLIQNKNNIDCIEFQCAHFGPYTQINAKKHYTIADNQLIEEANTLSIEQSYIYAISKFLTYTP